MSTRTLRIGLLQCGAVPPALSARHGDYPALYAALIGSGFDWRVFRCFEGQVPEDASQCDGWLVSGSRHGAYEDHAWIPPLASLIRKIHGTRPLVGICFGHQMVSQALGGLVEKFAGGWSVGRTAYDWEGETVHLNAWHQDQVTRPPPEAETILTSAFTAHAGFSIGADTLTLQPHPEFPADYVAGLIDLARGRVPDPRLDAAAADLDRPLDMAATGARLARFIRDRAP